MRAAALSFRSWTLWLLGYPQMALANADLSLKDARELGQASALMYSLAITSVTYILRGEFATANLLVNELCKRRRC